MSIPFKSPLGKPPVPKSPTVEEQLAVMTAGFTGLTTAISTLVERLDKPAATPAPQPAPRPAPAAPPEFVPPTDEEYAQNPNASITRLVQHLTSAQLVAEAGPVVAAAFDTSMQLARENLKKTHKGLYDFLEVDFNNYLRDKAIPHEILSTRFPDGRTGMEVAFDQVVGANFNKVMDTLKKLPAKPERGEAPFTERGGPRSMGDVEADDRLSAAELEVAKTLDLSPDDYLAGRKGSIITSPEVLSR